MLDHQDAIAPEHNDPIHELLEDLGEVPTIESLIGESLRGKSRKYSNWTAVYFSWDFFYPLAGENPLPPDDPNKEMMGKTEVSLTLTNKFDVPGEANAETDAKTLLLKYVVFSFWSISDWAKVHGSNLLKIIFFLAPRGSL